MDVGRKYFSILYFTYLLFDFMRSKVFTGKQFLLQMQFGKFEIEPKCFLPVCLIIIQEIKCILSELYSPIGLLFGAC